LHSFEVFPYIRSTNFVHKEIEFIKFITEQSVITHQATKVVPSTLVAFPFLYIEL